MTKRKPTRFLVGVDTVTPRSTVEWPSVQVEVFFDTTDVVNFIEHDFYREDRALIKRVNSYLRFLKSLDRVIASCQDARSVKDITNCIAGEISERLDQLYDYAFDRFIPTIEFRTQVMSAGASFNSRFYISDKYIIQRHFRDFEPVKRKLAFNDVKPYKTVTGSKIIVAQDCVFNEQGRYLHLTGSFIDNVPHGLWNIMTRIQESPQNPFLVSARDLAELMYSYDLARAGFGSERGTYPNQVKSFKGLYSSIADVYDQIFGLLTPVEQLGSRRREELDLA